eukprot:gene11604-34308_t
MLFEAYLMHYDNLFNQLQPFQKFDEYTEFTNIFEKWYNAHRFFVQMPKSGLRDLTTGRAAKGEGQE